MFDLNVLQRIIEATRKFLEIVAKLNLLKVDQAKLEFELAEADKLIAAGELEAALLQYQRIAEAFPKSGRPVLGKIWVYMEQEKHIDALALCGLAIALEQGNKKRTACAKAFVGQVHFAFFEKYKGRDQLNDCIDKLTQAHKDDPSSLMIMHNITQVTAIGKHRCARARKADLEKWQEQSNKFFDELIVTYRGRPANRDEFVQIEDFINACSDYKELEQDLEFSQRMRKLERIQADKRQLLSQPLDEEIKVVVTTHPLRRCDSGLRR